MNVEHYICKPDDSIQTCISKILDNGLRSLFVVDTTGKLLGSLTEGDLLRALQQSVSTQFSVAANWHNSNCFFVKEGSGHPDPIDVFLRLGHVAYPIVDQKNVVIGIATLRDRLAAGSYD